ncbi:MAG: hypothetical protein IJ634_05605 [Bacteroidales bacterium]|nr:hypothetical protein [Bacteroidales bacterium]
MYEIGFGPVTVKLPLTAVKIGRKQNILLFPHRYRVKQPLPYHGHAYTPAVGEQVHPVQALHLDVIIKCRAYTLPKDHSSGIKNIPDIEHAYHPLVKKVFATEINPSSIENPHIVHPAKIERDGQRGARLLVAKHKMRRRRRLLRVYQHATVVYHTDNGILRRHNAVVFQNLRRGIRCHYHQQHQ